jgi:hypothetical protein
MYLFPAIQDKITYKIIINMVPIDVIEMSSDPYQGSVLPLN